MAVMIGIDPHKGSHTAVAVTAAGEPLGKIRIRACPARAGQLVTWAAAWPDRIWAVEGAPGLGRLLARQLIAADPGSAATFVAWQDGNSQVVVVEPPAWDRCPWGSARVVTASD
jgi:hypothetical protein